MYFLVRGRVSYECSVPGISMGLEAAQDNYQLIYCENGDTFCEAVLWIPWVHRGHMRAHLDTALVLVEATNFRKTLSRHESVLQWTRTYAEKFLACLNQWEEEFRGEGPVTDLQSKIQESERLMQHLGLKKTISESIRRSMSGQMSNLSRSWSHEG
eukprot:gnl/TRDRNA2_/TRDRNA2_138088_c0_seq1.p1 gnl/TRDRNA2_/TRDRNA2_138088_c0~~gnl/TRDRNA2_/TRDRNA2_138088_c0_seq1.p1  ORF type:complete len:156 (-),score=11.84 gnl/TRDRNA2_/TRDRNA2_138088_c0_seq1:88-555(-)